MSLPTPNFVLDQDYETQVKGASKTLPAGSFVRPIDIYYVPKHIIEQDEEQPYVFRFRADSDLWCFTHYGILKIPKKLVRKL